MRGLFQGLKSFVLVTGHGVDPSLTSGVREAAREFFALAEEVKAAYAVRVGGHGWLAPGAEANAYSEGTETPPDLKESFSLGAETATGDADVDRIWYAPNVWPAEVPRLQSLVTRYTAAMRAVSDDLLALFCHALQLPRNVFRELASMHRPIQALASRSAGMARDLLKGSISRVRGEGSGGRAPRAAPRGYPPVFFRLGIFLSRC